MSNTTWGMDPRTNEKKKKPLNEVKKWTQSLMIVLNRNLTLN